MRSLVVISTLVILSTTAAAQGIPLPKLDSVTFFGEVGDFEGKDVVDSRMYGPIGAFGWGFETGFTVTAKDDYLVEIGMGYDQLFQRGRLRGFAWTGEVRDLPSTAIYVSFPDGLYVGLATGIASLANASIDDGTSRFSVGGDTFDAAGVVGFSFSFEDRPLDDRRVGGFVELAYHARYFGGVDYGAGAPASLPASLYLGGFAASVGVQIAIGAKAAITAKPKVPPASSVVVPKK